MSQKHTLIATALTVAVTTMAVLFFFFFFTNDDKTTFAVLVVLVCWSIGVTLCLLTRDAFRLRDLPLPGLFLLSYAAMIGIPSVFIFLGGRYPNEHSYLLATQSVFITFPLAVWLTRRLAGSVRGPHRALCVDLSRLRIMWNAAFLTGVGIFCLHLIEVGHFPLYAALAQRGDWVQVAQLREEAGRLLPGTISHYLYFWNRILILPGLVILALAVYQIRRQIGWGVRMVAAFAVAILHGTLTLEKSFGAMVFIALAVFIALSTEKRRLLRLSLGVATALLFPLFVFWWILPVHASWAEVLMAAARRVFVVPAEVTLWHFMIVPSEMDFLHGATVRAWAVLTGAEHFDLASYIFRLHFPYVVEAGIAGIANTGFVGAGWADFGWVGVIGQGLLAGVIVQGTYRMVKGYHFLGRTLHALAVVPFTLGLNSVPLQVVLLTYGVGLLLLVFWLLRYLVYVAARP